MADQNRGSQRRTIHRRKLLAQGRDNSQTDDVGSIDLRSGTKRRQQREDRRTFECVWCKNYAEEPSERYTMSVDQIGGRDEETGLPICMGCADAARE